MPWSLEHIENLQIVELTISGRVSGDELKDAAAARIALGQEKGVDKYIINVTHIDAPESTTAEVYDIPTKMYAEKNLSRASQIAVIAPLSSESMWVTGLYEDICVNRGWRVQTFLDRNLAIDWLQESGLPTDPE
jgi:hypothetical protein